MPFIMAQPLMPDHGRRPHTMKELPRERPVNPAAEREPKQPLREPDLESAIDDETGGLIRPSRDDVRTDKHPEDADEAPHHH
jgi:hypothetical protein